MMHRMVLFSDDPAPVWPVKVPSSINFRMGVKVLLMKAGKAEMAKVIEIESAEGYIILDRA